MKLTKGQTIYSGGQPGTVIRIFGDKAVQVITAFERPEQDFLTHKVTVIKGYRKETWATSRITLAI